MSRFGFYWRSAQHDLQDDVDLVLAVHRILAQMAPRFGEWWLKGDSPEPNDRIEFSQHCVRKILIDGMGFEGTEPGVLSELGTSLSGWSPADPLETMSFRLNVCPDWFETNLFEIEFSSDITIGELPLPESDCIELFSKLNGVLKPDRSALTSPKWSLKLRSTSKAKSVGWLTFTRNRVPEQKFSPNFAHVIQASEGSLVKLCSPPSEITIADLQLVQDAIEN